MNWEIPAIKQTKAEALLFSTSPESRRMFNTSSLTQPSNLNYIRRKRRLVPSASLKAAMGMKCRA